MSLTKGGILGDISVYEDSVVNTLQLATFVDDEQDVEANMKWDVVGSNMDAFDNILTDWTDQSGVDGTLSITPINDQFGTFEQNLPLLTLTDKLTQHQSFTLLSMLTTLQ